MHIILPLVIIESVALFDILDSLLLGITMKKLLVFFIILKLFLPHASIAMEDKGADGWNGYEGDGEQSDTGSTGNWIDFHEAGSDGEGTSTTTSQATGTHTSTSVQASPYSIETWGELEILRGIILSEGKIPKGVTVNIHSLMQKMKTVTLLSENPIAFVEKIQDGVENFFDEYQPEEHVALAVYFQIACERFIEGRFIEEVIKPLQNIPENFTNSQIFASEFFQAAVQRRDEIQEQIHDEFYVE